VETEVLDKLRGLARERSKESVSGLIAGATKRFVSRNWRKGRGNDKS
jgi:hypothetical protein